MLVTARGVLRVTGRHVGGSGDTRGHEVAAARNTPVPALSGVTQCLSFWASALQHRPTQQVWRAGVRGMYAMRKGARNGRQPCPPVDRPESGRRACRPVGPVVYAAGVGSGGSRGRSTTCVVAELRADRRGASRMDLPTAGAIVGKWPASPAAHRTGLRTNVPRCSRVSGNRRDQCSAGGADRDPGQLIAPVGSHLRERNRNRTA